MKLEFYESLSNFAFEFNLRRCKEAIVNDKRVFYLGAMQSLFEASMYSFGRD